MDEFTFPTSADVPRGQCKLPAFPPPWFIAVVDDDRDGAPWGGDDQKMDMLWEDFNDELTRTPPVCPLSPLMSKGGSLMTMMKEAAWIDDADGVAVGVAVGKGNKNKHGRKGVNAGSLVRRRRWSLLLMLRLLKKLFLVKRSRNQRMALI